mmetsp:Transcript_2130/g.5647  ORF Transcript_2130/g.5647 Transcript_2130/m.5647 type:complete len:226 (-) Transcript_2130:314-991(-)
MCFSLDLFSWYDSCGSDRVFRVSKARRDKEKNALHCIALYCVALHCMDSADPMTGRIRFASDCQILVRSPIDRTRSAIPRMRCLVLVLFFAKITFCSFCFVSLFLLFSLLASLGQSRRIAHNDNDRITPQKHFANVSILVDRCPSSFPLSSLGRLRPHFFDVLQEQIHVSIVGLDSSQELVVVSNVDQYLRVSFHGSPQDTKGSGFEVCGIRIGILFSVHCAVLC